MMKEQLSSLPNMHFSKIFQDIFANIAAGILPIVVLQLFLLPSVARYMGADSYGQMLSMVSMLMLVSNSLGNVLNNVRLLRQNEYKEIGATGDFNFILVFLNVINVAIIVFGCILVVPLSPADIAFVLVLGTLLLLQAYISVGYRLHLTYSRVLINSVILVFAYVAGYLLFLATGIWQLIYIIGYGLSICNMLMYKNMLHESYGKTPLFKHTLSAVLALALATIFGSAMSYADKMLLYPLLGGSMVSIYYSASIIGKMCSMVVSPISNVMLSYLTKMCTISKKVFTGLLLGGTALCIIGYFFGLMLSGFLLPILYPAWAGQSLEITHLTTATAMLSMLCSILNPVILKSCHLNWQVKINCISIVVYMALGYCMVLKWGLKGFAAGVLVSYALKIVLMIFVFWKENGDFGMDIQVDKEQVNERDA